MLSQDQHYENGGALKTPLPPLLNLVSGELRLVSLNSRVK